MNNNEQPGTEIKKPGLSEREKELVYGSFTRGLLDRDVLNAWAEVLYVMSEKSIENITPVLTYEDYFKDKDIRQPGMRDYVMLLSDPAAVAEFDALVAEFNDKP